MRGHLRSAFIGLLTGLAFNATIAFAWTGPTASAPNSNVGAPVNVGTSQQVKNGDLGVNNFSIFGNALLSGLGVGSGRYLNFDYTSDGTSGTGSAGYGIRDNEGTLEFKNSGGVWTSLSATIQNYLTLGGITLNASRTAISEIEFADGTTQTTAAPTSAASPSGTWCGLATRGATDYVCSSGSYTSIAQCNGQSITTSCPSGYTLQSVVGGMTVGDSSYVTCFRTCTKN